MSCPPLTGGAGFLEHARDGTLALPAPGGGESAVRLEALRRYSLVDGSVGRLVESHADALAILADAHMEPPSPAALAVWASDSSSQLSLHPHPCGYAIDGVKHFCGGATLVDAALITAMRRDEPVLLLVDLHHPSVTIDPKDWKTPAFANAGIATVTFASTPVTPSAIVGGTGFYGNRRGFWYGAIGVAAGWAGLLDALIEHRKSRREDELSKLANGELAALQWSNHAALAYAAQLMDDPRQHHTVDDARDLALVVRHCVRVNTQTARQLIDHETGPTPLVFDAEWQRRRNELELAILQSHGRRDIALVR